MPPPIPLLFGPMLLGAFFNTILYGVMIVQLLVYFQTYKKDSWWLRSFIFYLLIAETLNTGFSIGLLYEPLILKYGQPAATTFFPLMLPAEPIMTVVISTPIQMFIAWRIRVISERSWVPGLVVVLSLVSCGGGTWLAYTVTAIRRFSRKPDLHRPALTWLLASAIADVIITVALVYNLTRRKTGIVQTDDTINKIIRMTVQTGLITAIFAVLDVICFLVLPNTTLNFFWDLALCKLYTNALMSTLNAREGLGRMMSGEHGQTNVLFADNSFLDENKGQGLHLSFRRSRSLDADHSRTINAGRSTQEDIEMGAISVKGAHDI
ncbi:hypothetical protein P691DRAFT_289478 [Macrolepiota fuliginosa MF-IS2]|uniref:DUF6534 domain-containing protein n=1 Tax=Macrolepiota fuliginosa MF-IS2 TaxID=1400762 RepID=A0A9P5X875_9AGAR|nr:hypothetical protein P691DRAFT_289478 [Macrolepiota fuliginosa MF-IS2]